MANWARILITILAECGNNKFACADEEQCIFRSRWCDGVVDCDDASDESLSCVNHTCLKNRKKCNDQLQCVKKSSFCDKKKDCNDYSDEIGCGVCSDKNNEFPLTCRDSSACMSTLQSCDGVQNCDDGSDELNCTVNCPFGNKGHFCNETCEECLSPYCKKNLFEITEEFYTYDGAPDTASNVKLCVHKSTTFLEIKNMFLINTTRNIFKEIGGSVQHLLLRNITNNRLNENIFYDIRDSLKFLYLTQINLVKYPDLKYFKNLILFELKFHSMTAIPQDMFWGSIILQRITVSHGLISNIHPKAFSYQTKLERLYLSFNQLDGTNLMFLGLRNLTVLDLSYNCIEFISNGLFTELHSLQRLVLVGNPLSTLPIPQLSGVNLFGRSFDEEFKMFVPVHVNCSQFYGNQSKCEWLQYNLYNTLIWTDEIDSCVEVTCATNSTCVDVIPEGICFEKQQCCGFIDNFRCLLREEETPCSGNCRCYGDDDSRFKGFICENQELEHATVHQSRLCVPLETTELKLINVTLLQANETFASLLKRFGNLKTIVIENLMVPEGFNINEFHLNDAFAELLSNVTSFEFSHNLKLTQFPTLLLSSFSNVKNLSIPKNSLKIIPPNAFINNNQIEILDISNNEITSFDAGAFKGLSNLSALNISSNLNKSYPDGIFQDQTLLTEVHGDHFTICCLAGINSTDGIKICTPESAISSCTHLISNRALRVLIWLQAILAAIGNIIAVLKRVWDHRNTTSHLNDKTANINTFLVTILAIADFIMSVYLLIIAGSATAYAGEYYKHATTWENSPVCKTAGVLSLFSSQASVFTLTLITLTRLASAMFPFSYRTANSRIVHIITTVTWILALLLAFIPLMDKDTKTSYFSSSGVCLPSWYTSVDESGWQYTIFLTILNLLAFVIILLAYAALVRKVYKNDQKINTCRKSRRSTLGIRVMLIVGTDFLCWFPICIAALISLGMGGFGNNVYNIIYPWTAILLLPINSAINPILYTILPAVNLNQVFDKCRSYFKIRGETTTSSGNGLSTTSAAATDQNGDLQMRNNGRKISMPFTNSTTVQSISHLNPTFEDDEES